MSEKTSDNLALALAQQGLIQFGRFAQDDGAIWPVAVRLLWLPSCPVLLRDTAAALRSLVRELDAVRLLTTVDAIPLGTALALSTEIPMTYPYGEVRDYTAAYAIEGAYDVGHPTVLLADVLIDAAQAEQITALARRVGLDVHTVLAVLDIGLGARERLEALGYGVRTVFTLREMLPVLEARDLLPPI
ncbi:MAG: hypothetical protein K8S97_13235, partial [Anaerolineae bacterium]|nr:hypothetical protein [Anaerolineae bacterium]